MMNGRMDPSHPTTNEEESCYFYPRRRRRRCPCLLRRQLLPRQRRPPRPLRLRLRREGVAFPSSSSLAFAAADTPGRALRDLDLLTAAAASSPSSSSCSNNQENVVG